MTVFLVGAGPGDPDLITARGLRLVRTCDVLIHDRLVAQELVAESPSGALTITRERLGQDRVNELLVAYGAAGLEVVRLKGGDPFVFGRGGEEALALARAGVPFEVVPGVSALASVPAAAGIPLTHRGVSSQVTVVTGHDCEGGTLDIDALASTPGTVVVFMGLASLPRLASALVAAGRDARTPAAVIARGTLPDQVVASGTLGEIGALADGLPSPALVVIGDVVALAQELGIPQKRSEVRADAA
jgi:uroporphyrin-III C-methyltransferase